MIKNLQKNIFKLTCCPVCKESNSKFHSFSKKNLYSEILSEILDVKENKILKIFKNLECNKCKIIYKNYWFKKIILKKLFLKKIPIHPKGNDIFSNKFSKKYFLQEFNNLKTYYENDTFEFNKSKRIIISIIDSINSKNKIINQTIILLQKKKYNLNKLSKNIQKISFFF